MKKLILAAALAASALTSAAPAFAYDVYVNGYTRRDGTYVGSHHRTSPNGTCWDNYGGC